MNKNEVLPNFSKPLFIPQQLEFDEIFEILSAIKYILLRENISIEVKNISENKLDNFYIHLNILHKNLLQIKNNNMLIHGFIDKYNNELRQIKNFLLNRKNTRSRSIHDKIFTRILKLDKYISLGITKVFEEFIKGITYFSDELENKKRIPIYHRAASCGNSSENFKKRYLQCYKDNNEIVLETKRKHISKCYLERLIYDNIYKNSILHFPSGLNNVELEQNEGHIFQLKEREKNFNECFLGLKIEIQIFYEIQLPSYLMIKYIRDGNIEKIEEYFKMVFIDEFGIKQYADKTIMKITNKDGNTKMVPQFFDISKNNK
jgi:hypothetical protein